MSAIKRVFLCFFCVIIALFSFIFPASAIDSVYQFNCADPSLNGYDGYVVTPLYCNNSYIPSVLIAWKITPLIINGDALYDDSDYIISSSGFPTVSLQLTDSQIDITFSCSNSSNNQFYVSYFLMYNGDTTIDNSGSFTFSGNLSRSISFTASQLVSTSNYPAVRFGKSSYYAGLSNTVTYASGIPNFTYTCVFGSNVAIYEELSSIDNRILQLLSKVDLTNTKIDSVISHFLSLLSKVDYTNDQLDILVDYMSNLLETAYNIDYSLSEFVFYYWQEFINITFPTGINEITSKLEQIRKLLAAQGEVEQTTVNSDKVDEYADIEQSLINNDEAKSAISDFDISIDGQSYSFIWDLVTRIFNSHPEVFGLVITILTLGFLALILNR